MKLQHVRDENAVRAELAREYAEAFPEGSAYFTAGEWIAANLLDVMKRSEEL